MRILTSMLLFGAAVLNTYILYEVFQALKEAVKIK